MSLRKTFLPIRDRLLKLTDPQHFDVRPNKLTIRTRTWAGGRVGADGGYTDSDLVIPQRYRVEHVSAHEVASSGGRYELGDLKVVGISPKYAGGGFTPAQLLPPGAQGRQIIYRIDGPSAGDYQAVAFHNEEPFSYVLVLRKTRATP